MSLASLRNLLFLSVILGVTAGIIINLSSHITLHNTYYIYNNKSNSNNNIYKKTQDITKASSTQKTIMSNTVAKKMYPALFICHGGGPMPLLDDPDNAALVVNWKKHVDDIIARYGKPSAIAVVSAHYQKRIPEIGGCPMPSMMYDYGGFPEETYHYQYPAPGQPALAEEMVKALQDAGITASLNPQRPYDHGVFVPLMGIFAEADIPVVPVSVIRSNDPAEHIKMGKALRPFRERGVFFLGSGSSMHHFGNFDVPDAGRRFGDALTEALQNHPEWTPEQRIAAMEKVAAMDGFDEAHPPHAHEHLMPLLTLLGTADGKAAREVASIPFIQANVRHYLFEE